MGGLLYKDFVSVCRVKKVNIVWILIIITVLFISLRVMMPGYEETSEVAFNELGEAVSLRDGLFVILYAFFVIAGLSFINMCTAKIVEGDEKNKIKDYLNGMPLDRNAYVASKYLFIGIVSYVILSLDYVWGMVCMTYCEPGPIRDLCQVIMSFLITFACLLIFIASIELPLFLAYGKEKAAYIKVGLLLIVAFVVIGYAMFGDINWISEHFDIEHLINWYNKHQVGIVIFQSILPVICLALYFVSYKIACIFTARKE